THLTPSRPLLCHNLCAMSHTSEDEKRKQLTQMTEKMLQSFGKSNAPKLEEAKELAETLRKELEHELDQNEALWTERKVLKTLNGHINKTIEDNRELIEELNKL